MNRSALVHRLTVLGAAATLLASGCASDDASTRPDGPGATAPEPPAQTEAPGTLYEVKKGDTLYAIARRFALAEDELAEVNGLDDPDHLMPGQVLFIPHDEMGTPDRRRDVGPGVGLQAPPVRPVTAGDAGFCWPIEGGVLLREFNPAARSGMDGIVIAAPAGTPVVAAKAGRVVFAGPANNALGALIIVDHDDETLTLYGHLDKLGVKRGQPVEQGSVLGAVGVSGRAESPQLHFQVRKKRAATDPLALLPPP